MSRQTMLARFESAEALVAAVRAARAAGYDELEAYAPLPLPELESADEPSGARIPAVSLITAVFAGTLAYLMQWYASAVDYPFVVGGKPPDSPPAFLLITFEVAVLAAVLAALIGMLVGNGLPRPHHPVFDWPMFDRASSDGFFLLLADDDADAAEAFLRQASAAEVEKREP